MARAPRLTIDVTDLRRRLGQRRDVVVDLALDPIQVVDTRSTSAPVTGDLVVESIERGVRVTGAVTLGWEGECRRCLDEVAGEAVGSIDEIFQVDAPDDGDLRDFDGELVDLVPVVAETVAFSLPLAPLCRTDCPGPDPERYPTTTEAELEARAAAAEPVADPRWAALAELDLREDP